jgi:histidine ammonia-lyase
MCLQVVENVQKIFAIELLMNTHALHMRRKVRRVP